MNSFSKRHIGINKSDKAKMLDYLNVRNIDELISETIPENIRLQKEMKLKKPLSENEYLDHIERLGKKTRFLNPILEWDIISLLCPLLLKEIF